MSMQQGFTVWCDNDKPDSKGYVCSAFDQVSGTKSRAAKSFKESGWQRKRVSAKIIWLCPSCANEVKKP